MGVPRVDKNSMVDTIQSGHIDGEPGAIFNAKDVIWKALIREMGVG